MKANVLMIGDWVRVPSLNKNGKVYRIDRANGVGNGFIAVLRGDFHEDDIEPVLLTPEILEKNGFTHYGESWYLHLKDECVLVGFHMYNTIIDVKEGINGFHMEIPCSYRSSNRYVYVHQLQHALRLCGIEKEIEL